MKNIEWYLGLAPADEYKNTFPFRKLVTVDQILSKDTSSMPFHELCVLRSNQKGVLREVFEKDLAKKYLRKECHPLSVRVFDAAAGPYGSGLNTHRDFKVVQERYEEIAFIANGAYTAGQKRV